MNKLLYVGLNAGNGDGLQREFEKRFDVKHINTSLRWREGKAFFNQLIIDECQSFKPDLVFMQIQCEDIISPVTLTHIKCKVVNWTGDVRDEVPKWMLGCAPYCVSAFSNLDDVEQMRSLGFKAEYLQIGVDGDIFHNKHEGIDVPEIVFLANNCDGFELSDYRRELVAKMKEHFKERFGVYGSGWGDSSGENNSNLEEQAKIYNSCKIAINCSNYNKKRYSSDRLYRITASGAFCLSHNYPQIEDDWGEELPVFVNAFTLIQLCEYYLKKNKERKKLAKKAMENARANFLWSNFVDNLLCL